MPKPPPNLEIIPEKIATWYLQVGSVYIPPGFAYTDPDQWYTAFYDAIAKAGEKYIYLYIRQAKFRITKWIPLARKEGLEIRYVEEVPKENGDDGA